MNIILFCKKIFYFFFPKNTVGARLMLVRDNEMLFVKHRAQQNFFYFPGG